MYFDRTSNRVRVFNNRKLKLNFLSKGTLIINYRKYFSNFCQRHSERMSKYNVGLKTLLQKCLPEPEFYGNLIYKFRKLVGKIDY